MRITGVEPHPITLTLEEPVRMAHGVVATSHTVLVRVTTDQGVVGWGEGVAAPRLTGETQDGIVATLHRLAPVVVGEDPMRRAALWDRMMCSTSGTATAIGAIDIALHDIAGKALGVPVHQLLGGLFRKVIPCLVMIGSGDPPADADAMAKRQADGYRWFKVKLGLTDHALEAATMQSICAAAGPDTVVCADANGAWTETEAVDFVQRLAGMPVRYLEQPVSADDVGALVRVAERSPIPIGIDEGMHSLGDIVRLGPTAVAGVSLKLIKLGGITGVMRGALLCEAHGLAINLAGKVAESAISAAANLHCAAAMRDPAWGVSPANQGLVQDVSATPPAAVDGSYRVPQRPGLGVEVDEERLAALGGNRS